MSDTILDSLGKPLTVGIRVRCTGSAVGDAETNGVIRSISDADGDRDDYGRNVFYAPSVTVGFDDGSEDSFRAGGSFIREGYVCEDLVRVEER